MAYNYEWPYVDPNRHNSDWELNKVKELDARVTAAEQEIADFETTMKTDWAEYQNQINNQIDDFTGGMISQWNDYKQEMNQSWTTYQNSLNASWAAYQTKLNGDWDAYKAQMGTDWENYQQTINAQWAQYKTDTDADIASWKAGAINDLNAWKTATTADLTAWKQQANTDIASWEAATSASLDADFAQYRQTTDSAITAWETATSANLNKLLDDYKALINGEWAQYKTDTDADIAAFKSSVNVSLSGMDNRITAMQTAITTLQSDWATFQTSIQGDITTFENSINSALSSMRQDMTDFETDINAKISTQNAQIASMQTAVNNIPTTVNAAVDNKFNNLTPPYTTIATPTHASEILEMMSDRDVLLFHSPYITPNDYKTELSTLGMRPMRSYSVSPLPDATFNLMISVIVQVLSRIMGTGYTIIVLDAVTTDLSQTPSMGAVRSTVYTNLTTLKSYLSAKSANLVYCSTGINSGTPTNPGGFEILRWQRAGLFARYVTPHICILPSSDLSLACNTQLMAYGQGSLVTSVGNIPVIATIYGIFIGGSFTFTIPATGGILNNMLSCRFATPLTIHGINGEGNIAAVVVLNLFSDNSYNGSSYAIHSNAPAGMVVTGCINTAYIPY